MSASLAPECNEVKEPEYLRGNGNTDDNECATMFKDYQKCLQVALQERKIDKLLNEAREDSKEHDSTHLKRK
ncbi:uncharacterized protein PG998_001649 [Apiospora kogelbergensis]|uniref:Uncharacterized protein n=1 Tax=Apiospora kogelbergensis TaxID=1337665 RepID=A0AAW0QQS9_9PEZI